MQNDRFLIRHYHISHQKESLCSFMIARQGDYCKEECTMARKGYLTKTFTLPNGKRKYVTAKTQEELDEKVFNLKLQLRMGVDIDDNTTVGELIQMWYDAEVKPKVSANTATTIRSTINQHVLPYISGDLVREVTPLKIKMVLNRANGMTVNSSRRVLRVLRDAFALAEENGMIYKSPVLARYKAEGRPLQKRDALSPDEETGLLEVLQGTSAYLFVWMGLATGARRGELLGLKWDCVDLDRAEITLRRNLVFVGYGQYELHDYLKTESSTRVIPIPYDLVSALREEKATTNSVFVLHRPNGQPYCANQFCTMWGSVQRRSGPEQAEGARAAYCRTHVKVTPHVLRHTYATRCFEAGLDIKEVQRLLGHSSMQVTMEIYTHYCESLRRESTFDKAREARSRTTCVPQNTQDVPRKVDDKEVQKAAQ